MSVWDHDLIHDIHALLWVVRFGPRRVRGPMWMETRRRAVENSAIEKHGERE